MARLQVALVQLDAGSDVEANLRTAVRLADQAAAEGARLVALPEYLQYRGSDDGYRASARPIPGPFSDAFAAIAKARDAWILAGSLAESNAPGSQVDRPYNTSVLIDPGGTVVARYRKIHLFDVDIEDGPSDRESERVSAGDRAVVADVEATEKVYSDFQITAVDRGGHSSLPRPDNAIYELTADLVGFFCGAPLETMSIFPHRSPRVELPKRGRRRRSAYDGRSGAWAVEKSSAAFFFRKDRERSAEGR